MTNPDFMWFAFGVICGGLCCSAGYLAGKGLLPLRLLHKLGLTDLTDEEVNRYLELRDRK